MVICWNTGNLFGVSFALSAQCKEVRYLPRPKNCHSSYWAHSTPAQIRLHVMHRGFTKTFWFHYGWRKIMLCLKLIFIHNISFINIDLIVAVGLCLEKLSLQAIYPLTILCAPRSLVRCFDLILSKEPSKVSTKLLERLKLSSELEVNSWSKFRTCSVGNSQLMHRCLILVKSVANSLDSS